MGSEAYKPLDSQPQPDSETLLRLVPSDTTAKLGGAIIERARKWNDLTFSVKQNNLYGTDIIPTNPENRVRACINALVDAVPEHYALQHDLIEYSPGRKPGTFTSHPVSAGHMLQRVRSVLKTTVEITEPRTSGQHPRKTTKGEIVATHGIVEKLHNELSLENDPAVQLLQQIDSERGDRMTDAEFKQLRHDLLLVAHLDTVRKRINETTLRLRKQLKSTERPQ